MIRFVWLVTIFAGMAIRAAIADPWIADTGDGRYRNPVLFADYSDPDLVRVGEDYYMVASSFNAMPGIPVLHSRDLVNWTIIGHVYERLPFEKFDKPAHGHGSWAPAIRFHNGLFYVYFCTPHTGLFVATAKNPAGTWQLEQMAAVELWEDPAPFWDDDGNAYLVRSKVRADVLYLHRMSPDGKQLLSDGEVIYRDLDKQPVIEGPKMMKKDGWYYIFAPAGGVQTGWQAVLRSRSVYGPYDDRIVLNKGSTDINGPHQGGLVQVQSGEWWFMHFQDRGLYGRIVHLQPVRWEDDWPLIGEDFDDDGIGEPLSGGAKPDVGASWPVATPQTSDEFNHRDLGLQWQWHANPNADWYSLDEARAGQMRLFAVRNPTQFGNLRFVPNLLLQKFPAPAFSAETRIEFSPDLPNDKSGLVVMGREWGYLALYSTGNEVRLGAFKGHYVQYDDATEEIESIVASPGNNGEYAYYLRVDVANGGAYQFSYSIDGAGYTPIGEQLQATAGTWIGAKVGIFSLNPGIKDSSGYADFNWFRLR